MADAPRALIYVDMSAIVKLLFAEAESEALGRWLGEASPSLVSSALLEVELFRTVIRARSQSGVRVPDAAVRALLEVIDLIDLDAGQLKRSTASCASSPSNAAPRACGRTRSTISPARSTPTACAAVVRWYHTTATRQAWRY